ncbi:MAG: aminotransferase class IV [Bacteroidota bacterium]
MYPLFETIAIEKFQPQNIELHQQRMDISYLSLFKNTNPFNLSELIKYENIPSEGLFKWKILYGCSNYKTIVDRYEPRQINKVKFVHVDSNFDYTFKYSNRVQIDELRDINSEYDEIIMVKNGYLTDSSIANLVLKQKDKLYTPNTPLLEGTQRKYLIMKDRIIEKQILYKDLGDFEGVFFINSMLPFERAPFFKLD